MIAEAGIDRLVAEKIAMVNDYRVSNSWEICDAKVILSAKLPG